MTRVTRSLVCLATGEFWELSNVKSRFRFWHLSCFSSSWIGQVFKQSKPAFYFIWSTGAQHRYQSVPTCKDRISWQMNSHLGILKMLVTEFPITVIAFPEISGFTMNNLCVQPVFTSKVFSLWPNLPRHLVWLVVSKYQAKCECRNRYRCRCLLVPSLTARMSGVECSDVQTYPGARLQLLLTVPGG